MSTPRQRRVSRRSLVVLFALATAVVVAWYATHDRARGPRGVLALGPGAHAFDVSLTTSVRAQGGEVANFSLRGTLQIEKGRERDGVTEVVTSLEDALLTSSKASAQGLADMRAASKEFARPLVLHVARDGHITKVSEDASVRSQVRTMLKSIAAMSQFVESARGESEWTSIESDTSGEYGASYSERAFEDVRKKKTSYTALRGISTLAWQSKSKLTVDASSHHFQFAPNGRLSALSVSESLLGEGELLGGVTSVTTLSLRYRSTQASGHVASPALLADLKTTPLYGSAASPGFSADVDLARVAGRSFDEVMEEAERVKSAEELNDASREEQQKSLTNFMALSALFRVDRDAVTEAIDAIREGTPLAPRIWDALGAAGTPAAQAALREIIEMPDWDLTERRSQLISLSMVSIPTRETVQFLVDHFEDPEQGHQARLGVGTAAHNLRGVDPAAADAAFDELARALEATTDLDETAQLLHAMGNSGSERSLEIAKRYERAEAPIIRAGAASALRLAPQAEAAEELTKILREEPDPFVRTRAVLAVGSRGVSDWSLGLLEYVARNDPDPTVRSTALRVLSAFAGDDARVTPMVQSIVADSAGT